MIALGTELTQSCKVFKTRNNKKFIEQKFFNSNRAENLFIVVVATKSSSICSDGMRQIDKSINRDRGI